MDTWREPLAGRCRASVHGHVRPPGQGATGLIFLGLFPDVLPVGKPVRCTVLRRPGSFELLDIPLGSWHLLCYSVTAEPGQAIPSPRSEDNGVYVGSHGPITVRPETGERFVEIKLRPMSPLDPPVLPALLDERSLRTESHARQAVLRS